MIWCNFIYFFYLKNLENGYNVIQLETAVGAAIKNFEGALGETILRYQYGSVTARMYTNVYQDLNLLLEKIKTEFRF